MTLSSQPSYPHTHSYVLKLHRDAAPQHGRIVGRLEHLASGRHFDFASGDELVACLMLGATLIDEAAAPGKSEP